MDTTQIAVEVPEELLAKVDDLVASGLYKDRDEAISVGIAGLPNLEDKRRIDQAYIDGYTRFPQTAAELEMAQSILCAAIKAEPWEK